MNRWCIVGQWIACLPLMLAGCCGVPCGTTCGPAPCGPAPVPCGPSCGFGYTDPSIFVNDICDSGNCGTCTGCAGNFVQSFTSHCSCKHACGEVYIDERINEPPVPDHCGYPCGGCNRCSDCRPLLNGLRALWGTPYGACCDTSYLAGDCGDCGCDSCGSGGHIYESDVGGYSVMGHADSTHSMHPVPPLPAPTEVSPPSTAPSVPLDVPDAGSDDLPTPAPSVTPTSARRLSPARQRRVIRP